MGRKRKNKVLSAVEMIEATADGRCMGKHDGMVVFVKETAPGDVVDVQLTRQKRSFAEGYPTHFHSYSDQRTEPFCIHYNECGGCKWQHITYEAQLQFKQKLVKDNLERIGKTDLPEIQPIIGSEQTRFFRNKLEFTFTNNRWLTREEIDESGPDVDRNGLGFHMPGRFDRLVDIETCHLQPEPSNTIRNMVKKQADEYKLPFFSIKDKSGLLRNLIIRTSTTGDIMVILQVYYDDTESIHRLLDELAAHVRGITSLQYVVNPKANETFHDLEVICYAGKDHILEEMEDLYFKIGPKSFYQTNPVQAYTLYKVVREMVGLTGKEHVYDLYTGTGTIALFLARQAKRVTGVEYVEMAVKDAELNARVNFIHNAAFFAGDMKEVLSDDFVKDQGHPDVIITDPPRAGMHPDVVQTILRIKAPKIVYVSCNPATQARDLEMMKDLYAVKAVQPVDMFPHTSHVENVMLLELK